jgi:HEAT repeat protein
VTLLAVRVLFFELYMLYYKKNGSMNNMFFGSENKMEQLVKKHQWDKINKKLPDANTEQRIALATACGSSFDEGAAHTLINMLEDSDEEVLIQAIKSLGEVGSDNAKTHLRARSERLPEGNDRIKKAISESIAKLNISKRK